MGTRKSKYHTKLLILLSEENSLERQVVKQEKAKVRPEVLLESRTSFPVLRLCFKAWRRSLGIQERLHLMAS